MFGDYFQVRYGFLVFPKLLAVEILFWLSVVALVMLALLSKIPWFDRVYNKLLLYIDGIIGMVATNDTKWKQPQDWSTAGIEKQSSKRIVFIRHGESVWNECFNKGFGPSFPMRLFKRCVLEMSLYATPNTVFLDTPLNHVGLAQAVSLQEYLLSTTPNSISDPAIRDVVASLRGDAPENSLIVSSQLRRSLATTAIALKPRLEKTNEKILIHSACQEMSRNVDCMATSNPGQIPSMDGPDCGNAAELMTKNDQDKYVADEIFNPALNGGHKPLSERGLDRILNFADWTFSRPEHTIIVGGHSLWFRNFFKCFLPLANEHPAKLYKMENGTCATFILNMGKNQSGAACHWIEPSSVQLVHGSFVLPKKKTV